MIRSSIAKARIPSRVKMNSVNSSNVNAVGYDNKQQKMYIEFRNGAVYMYDNVNNRDYNMMLIASSKGKWFWSNIRQKVGKYPYTLIRKPKKITAKKGYMIRKSGLRRGFIRRRGVDFDKAVDELERVLMILRNVVEEGEELDNDLSRWNKANERERERLANEIEYWLNTNGDEETWYGYYADVKDEYTEEAVYLDSRELDRVDDLLKEYDEMFGALIYYFNEFMEGRYSDEIADYID